MKKYLILLLMGILPYLSLAQNKVENSYLSVTVPPGWHVQKQDMPGTKMELLNFFNDGPILCNHPKPTVLYVPQYVANFVSKKSCSI